MIRSKFIIVHIFFILATVFFSCKDTSGLIEQATLPKKLKEVSGITKIKDSDLLWMHNDSGNESYVYGLDKEGDVQRSIKVKAKNNDWEDITSDDAGNLYIGDFGNNDNKRKNLSILKIKSEDLFTKDKFTVEKIKFSYPDQYEFPPHKDQFLFDAEALFYFNKYLYVFTKSNVKDAYGTTKLYKIPAMAGKYQATLIGEFDFGVAIDNKITGACISPDKKKIALITQNKIALFSSFISDDFFNGDLVFIDLNHTSQKEAITFIDNNTVYITDEKNENTGGKLYQYTFSKKE